MPLCLLARPEIIESRDFGIRRAAASRRMTEALADPSVGASATRSSSSSRPSGPRRQSPMPGFAERGVTRTAIRQLNAVTPLGKPVRLVSTDERRPSQASRYKAHSWRPTQGMVARNGQRARFADIHHPVRHDRGHACRLSAARRAAELRPQRDLDPMEPCRGAHGTGAWGGRNAAVSIGFGCGFDCPHERSRARRRAVDGR